MVDRYFKHPLSYNSGLVWLGDKFFPKFEKGQDKLVHGARICAATDSPAPYSAQRNRALIPPQDEDSSET